MRKPNALEWVYICLRALYGFTVSDVMKMDRDERKYWLRKLDFDMGGMFLGCEKSAQLCG